MNSKIQIEIVTPTSTQSMSVEWVEIESPTGSFLVGPDHCALISIIRNQSTITYKKESEPPATILASQGIFTIENNKAIILLDQ